VKLGVGVSCRQSIYQLSGLKTTGVSDMLGREGNGEVKMGKLERFMSLLGIGFTRVSWHPWPKVWTKTVSWGRWWSMQAWIGATCVWRGREGTHGK
jgi:hypothetical protein